MTLLGVPMTRVPRKQGPPRPRRFCAAEAFDDLESDCDRRLRRLLVGAVLIALGVAAWFGGGAEPAAASEPVGATSEE